MTSFVKVMDILLKCGFLANGCHCRLRPGERIPGGIRTWKGSTFAFDDDDGDDDDYDYYCYYYDYYYCYYYCYYYYYC